MKLTIVGKIPEGINLLIKFNEKKNILCSEDNTLEFDFNASGTYDIYIEQIPTSNPLKIRNLLFYLLTFLLQGVFNILLMNLDFNWWKDLNPFSIKSKLEVNLNSDCSIDFIYNKSKFDYLLKKWSEPNLIISGINCSTVVENNKYELVNGYMKYIKQLLSIFAIIIVMLTFFLYISVKNNIILAILFISILMFFLVSLVIVLIVINYKKLRVFNKKLDS